MKILIFFAAVMLTAGLAFGANTDDVLGLWKTADDESKLEVFRCGEKLCIKIAWLKEPNYTDSKEGPLGAPKTDRNNPDPALRNRPMLGLQIMQGFTPAGEDRWDNGTIYNPDNGKLYGGKLHLLSHSRLELRGFMGVSLFGRNYILTR